MAQSVKRRRRSFDPWAKKIPWRREWQPTPVYLAGDSPWVARVGHDLVTNPPLPPFPYTPVMSLLPCVGSYCKIATFGAGSGKDGNKPGKRRAGNQESPVGGNS